MQYYHKKDPQEGTIGKSRSTDIANWYEFTVKTYQDRIKEGDKLNNNSKGHNMIVLHK